MNRNTVFLDEMGVGVQWRLRNRAVPLPLDEQLAPLADDAAAPAPAAQPAPVQAAPAPQADAQAAIAQPPVALAPAEQPAAAAPAAPAAAAPAMGDDSTAWFDEAPPPPPRADAVAPAKPAPQAARPQPAESEPPAMDEDSNAWFDESPIPAEALAPQATRRGPVSEEAIAGMDWPTLQAAVKTCTRCNLCQTRETAVHGRGDEQAEWLVVAAAPTADDEADDYAMTGKPGYLLDGMLRAVNQSTEKGAYITTLVKCRPADGQPSEEQLQACRPYLDRELQLSGAKVVVALGHVAGKGLLGAAARGRIMLYQDIPVVATYHPANLLQQPEDKAKAWADLCLAKSAHAGRR